MLHEFLTANRDELIRRCRAKASLRDGLPVSPSEPEYGVPLFLEQLVEALHSEQAGSVRFRVISGPWSKTAAAVEGSRTAALHGKELLARGYTVDQVVHGYGDVCQAVTELASERNASVSVEEFHTFNRLLDNAIADAVSSYARHREESLGSHGEEDLHERIGSLADAQRDLLETALKALQALKVGNIGLKGATGILLEESLVKLRDLIDQSLPQIRLAAGMTTAPKAGQGS
jgi:hypothetical protein